MISEIQDDSSAGFCASPGIGTKLIFTVKIRPLAVIMMQLLCHQGSINSKTSLKIFKKKMQNRKIPTKISFSSSSFRREISRLLFATMYWSKINVCTSYLQNKINRQNNERSSKINLYLPPCKNFELSFSNFCFSLLKQYRHESKNDNYDPKTKTHRKRFSVFCIRCQRKLHYRLISPFKTWKEKEIKRIKIRIAKLFLKNEYEVLISRDVLVIFERYRDYDEHGKNALTWKYFQKYDVIKYDLI